MWKRMKLSRYYWIIAIPILAIIGKIIRYTILSSLISNGVGNLIVNVLKGKHYNDLGLNFSSWVFLFMKFTNNYDLEFWELIISILFNFSFYRIIRNYRKPSIVQFIIANVSCVLLNTFVFNVGKDIIQYIAFVLIYYILVRDMNKKLKYFLIGLTLILEVIYFRTYFLIYMFFLIVSFVYKKIAIKKEKQVVFLLYLLFITLSYFFMLVASKIIIPNMYALLVLRRDNLTYESANTVILNLFRGDSPIIAYINFLINLIRIAFPIELLRNSFKYIPFVIYQFYVVIMVIRNKNKFLEGNYIWFSLWSCFFLMSITFEPDFGSVLRHQAVAWIFLFFSMDNYSAKRIVLKRRSMNV